MNTKILKILALFLVPVIFWFTPAPAGLSVEAWRLFGFYLAAIVGLVIKPFPAPVVLLVIIACASIFMNNTREALGGYASVTTWIIFAAFSLSIAFVSTGLGKRIAYILIGKFGQTTLRLGIVTAFLDLIISPATPSNTARAGGIVTPIIASVSRAIGSEPDKLRKTGAYLTCNIYMSTKVTSFMFPTAMAGNLLAADYIQKMVGVDLNWGFWAMAMIVPGLALLFIIPVTTYFCIRPEIKHVDNKKIAEEGLATLGAMKTSEKVLLGIFIAALLGWCMPSLLESLFAIKIKLHATAVAIAAMASSIVLGVITWDDMLKNKEGWNTLIWFGGLIGLSSALNKLKFFEWLGKFMEKNIDFGSDAFMALIIISILSILVRYFFASATAYIGTVLPVFLLIGKSVGIDPMLLALMLATTNSYGGAVTHFGGPAAPIIFGAGWGDVKEWWITGAVTAYVCLFVCFTVGIAWWKLLGLF